MKIKINGNLYQGLCSKCVFVAAACASDGEIDCPYFAEEKLTDTQQLKAKISEVLGDARRCKRGREVWYELDLCDYEELQKLSAV